MPDTLSSPTDPDHPEKMGGGAGPQDQAVFRFRPDVAIQLLEQPQLGKWVKAYRTGLGLSLRQVEAESGVTVTVLFKLEAGGDVKLSNVVPLLRWLNRVR